MGQVGTGWTLPVPPFQSRLICSFRFFPYQKPEGVLIEFEEEKEQEEFRKFLITNRSQIGQKSKLKSTWDFIKLTHPTLTSHVQTWAIRKPLNHIDKIGDWFWGWGGGFRPEPRASFHRNLLFYGPLQHDSTLKKTFQSKVFFEMWNDNEKSKQKSEKRELGKDRWYNQMGQVGTGWRTLHRWDREGGLHNGWDRMGLRQGGLQITGSFRHIETGT